MTVRWLQQQRSSEAIVSALVRRYRVSRRQAYRYLVQAQNNLELRPVPESKAVFTVNLPLPLIRAVRARCREQRQPISRAVAQVLKQWLEQSSAHG
jgi:hypothetical protein